MYHQVLAALLLQLCCAAAAPIANDQVNILGMSPQQQCGAGGGIFGFIVLVLDIIVWSRSPLPHPYMVFRMLTDTQSRC